MTTEEIKEAEAVLAAEEAKVENAAKLAADEAAKAHEGLAEDHTKVAEELKK